MLNYALAIILSFTSFYPTDKSIHNEFDSLIKKSGILYGNGKIDEAIMMAQNAMKFATKHDYEWGESKSLFVIAYFSQKDQAFEKAVPYYFELLNNYDEIGTQEAFKDKCKVYLNLGNVMRYHSKHHEALKYYDLGISISQKHNLNNVLYSLINNKINTYIDLKDFDSANKILLEIATPLQKNDEIKILKGLNQSGLIYDGLNKKELARLNFKKIIALESIDPTPSFSGTAYINIASSYLDENKFELAIEYYNQALLLSELHDESEDIFLIHLSYGELYLKKNDFDNASYHAKKAEEYFNSIKQTKESISIFSLLSDINFEMGNIEAGKKYAKIHASKLSELIDRQQKITEIGNQYKMDYITTSYFSEKEKRRNTNTFIWVIVTMVLSFILFRLYQLYKKIMVGRLLRKEMATVDFDLDS